MKKDDQRAIISALESKRKNAKCPSCEESQWILAEQYIALSLQEFKDNTNVLGGPSIPTVGLICKNCGYVSFHSTKILANLPKEEGQK